MSTKIQQQFHTVLQMCFCNILQIHHYYLERPCFDLYYLILRKILFLHPCIMKVYILINQQTCLNRLLHKKLAAYYLINTALTSYLLEIAFVLVMVRTFLFCSFLMVLLPEKVTCFTSHVEP